LRKASMPSIRFLYEDEIVVGFERLLTS